MKGSIFFKLLGILIITGVLVNLIVFAGVRLFMNANPIKRDLFEIYSPDNLEKVAGEIGYPPSLPRMEEFAKTSEGEVRVESEGKVWQTQDKLPTLDQADDHKPPHFMRGDRRWDKQLPQGVPSSNDKNSGDSPPEFRGPPPPMRNLSLIDIFQSFSKKPSRPAIVLNIGTVRYGFFFPDRHNFADKYQKLVFPILLLVTFLIASAFFAIRFILLPLQVLMKGVEAVADGDLEHRVRVTGGGEFGALGDSFNRMVERIKETVEAKERLLIDISHELQSPLARMKLAIELMQEDKAKERLKINLKDIEGMVAEILESARLDSSTGSLQIQKSDLKHIVKEFLYVYEAMGSPVFLDEIPGSLIVELDPSRLIIVLRNLIENALKHADSQDKRVGLRISEERESVRVEVKDNGKGIEPDEVSRLFEPFYRIDKSRNRKTGGYGLGLSLCKRIIDAHHGTIGIESGEGGTTVWFTLPKKTKVQ